MKALFVTTHTDDCLNHIRAWNLLGEPAEHYRFNYKGIRNDWKIIETAEKIQPEVIFYIGCNEAPGLPKPESFRALRKIAPVINLVSDAADKPWHSVLLRYKENKCFDLQVSIDGANHAPVDYATLTPVDFSSFVTVSKDILCGFSGSVAKQSNRGALIAEMVDYGIVTRHEKSDYRKYSIFLSRCRMIINTSFTGTGKAHHIKGRVLEAGWAGCALLEHADSPIGEWFPQDCYFSWRTTEEAENIIIDMDPSEVKRRAQRLSEEVRSKYTPKLIYQGMLDRVDFTVSRQTG